MRLYKRRDGAYGEPLNVEPAYLDQRAPRPLVSDRELARAVAKALEPEADTNALRLVCNLVAILP